ncbi:MAG: hypothetical protein IKO78_00825 [Bacilli bacterium]|nr:hypothetical protein [Bacilli bacterium]
MRKFEKISFEQFKKDVADDKKMYEEFEMPSRETTHSAGYDFHALEEMTLKPQEIKRIPTGIKATMEDDEVLYIHVRGSQGFKYNVRLCNQVGVVDKDYYNNPGNEGHIWIALQNEVKDDYIIKKGQGIAQGIFAKFLLTDNDADQEKEKRMGQNDYLRRSDK